MSALAAAESSPGFSLFPDRACRADKICLAGLAAVARLGVTPEERAFPQRILLDVTIYPRTAFTEMADDVRRTVDYAVVSQQLRNFCATGQWALLETLAVDCARLVLDRHPADLVQVRLRKFILPETDYVAVEHAAWRQEAS